jgi:hypothetical protein
MAARSGLCVASLAAIVCIAAPSFTGGASDKPFSIYIDSDAPGYDYKRIDPPSFSYCENRCGAETTCKAFTYYRTKQVCFLKDNGNIRLIPQSEAITGLKVADKQFSISKYKDAPGYDYDRVDPPSAGECQRLCNAEKECSAFSYNVTGEGWGAGVLKAVDRSSDLALVKFEFSSSPVTFRSTPAEIGEDVFAIGYPYAGELGLHFTKGSVSSITGPENDLRLLQFTAPVQPGVSGGPLLDKSGLMVGVVRALLMQAQNVNFAIHADLVASFLRRNDIDPVTAASSSEVPSPPEIAKRAKLHTFRLSCPSGG